MARHNNHNNSRRRAAAAATAAFVLALTSATTGAAAARLLRSENNPSFPTVPSYGSYHGVEPDFGPTGDLLHGPAVTPGKSSHSSATNRGNAGSPPARNAFARIQGSYAQAEARRDGSGFEGIEPENVVSAMAGNVRMTRVQSETMLPSGTTYTGTAMENMVGGRMAVVAATQNGARARAVSGGRPIVSRYGATPQTASIRMNAGLPLSFPGPKMPVAIAGSGQVHTASISGTGDQTGVIASTRLTQAISKSG